MIKLFKFLFDKISNYIKIKVNVNDIYRDEMRKRYRNLRIISNNL
jgi:hypothetical protein